MWRSGESEGGDDGLHGGSRLRERMIKLVGIVDWLWWELEGDACGEGERGDVGWNWWFVMVELSVCWW